MMTTRAVLFDLDGTLADTAPDLGLALNLQRERHGLSALPLEVIRPYASHGTRGLLGIGFGLNPEQDGFGVMREEYLDLYDQVFTHAPVMFEGIGEVLAALENAGVPWGVVTNKPRRFTLPLMAALGLSSRASCIVSGDDATQPKPHPDTLLLACRLANIAPDQCIYVGDAERDVVAGNAAGMRTVVARYGYLDVRDKPEEWGAAAMIDTPQELLQKIAL